MIGHGPHQQLVDDLAAQDGRQAVLLIIAEGDGHFSASGSLRPELLPSLVRCLRKMADEFERDQRRHAEAN